MLKSSIRTLHLAPTAAALPGPGGKIRNGLLPGRGETLVADRNSRDERAPAMLLDRRH